jgi:hypothetical protein
MDERARDRHPLRHPARQVARPVTVEAFQPDKFHHLLHFLMRCAMLHAGQLERQPQVLTDGAPWHQVSLLEDHPDPRMLVAVESHLPGCGRQQPGQDAQQRAFAAARRPQHAREFLRADFERDIVQRA